jgi:hypothetical protein
MIVVLSTCYTLGGPLWSFGSWIYNYLWNRFLSPLTLWLRIHCGEVYSIQHYVINFVSYLRHLGGFLLVLPISSNNKTNRHDITEILLKVVFKHHKPNLLYIGGINLYCQYMYVILILSYSVMHSLLLM